MANYRQINPLLISANNSSVGQVLTSNGTVVYWETGSGGYTGSQGVGFTGSTGYTGSRGTDGVIGYNGSVGFVGSKGDLGYTGSVGSGFVGSAGYLGSTGFVGSKGDLGYTGSIGFTGSAATSSFTNGQSISINNLISTGQIYVGNGIVNTVITDTSITTPLLNFTTNTSISTFSTELDDTTPKTVTFGNVPLNSATANGYTVEFFVKFKTLPTSGLSEFGSRGTNQLGLNANTSMIRVVNNGYAVAGDIVYRTFENNVWYHFAYIGQSNNTYIAIDGQVTNLNNIGGYSGYTPTGTWSGGWTRLSGNAVFSNFRVVTNQGGNVYDINGFTPPGSPLTSIANTKILTLIGNTFVDASGIGTTITTAGSPTLINDTIVNDGQSIATTIDGTTLSVSNIYTNFLYANNAAGNTGQLLAANSTGGIFWTNVIGYAGSVGFTGSVGYAGSKGDLGYTGSRGADGVIGYNGSVGFTGSKGDLGYTGSTGYTGSFGATGYTGSFGVTGYTGSLGSTGSTGYVGSFGYTGSYGDLGYTGSTGAGYVGSQGDLGYTGSFGNIGYTGSFGDQGVRGYTGSAGSSGGGGGGASVTVSNTAPSSNLTNGNLWWSTEEGTLKIYYDDQDSSQWVDASNPSPSFNAISLTGPISANTITAAYSLTGASLSVTGTAAARDLTITNNISTGSMTVSGALSLGDLVVSTVNAATIVRTPILNVSNYAIISTVNAININVSGNSNLTYILANNSQGTAGQLLISGGSATNVSWRSFSTLLNTDDQTITKVYTFNANTVFNRNSTFANAVTFSNTATFSKAVTFSNTVAIANVNNAYISNTTIRGFREQTVSNTAVIASEYALDPGAGSMHLITLTTATTTISLPSPVLNAGRSITLIANTGISGGYTVTWSNVTWPDGVTPYLSTTAGKKDVMSFVCDGSTWYGMFSASY